MPPVFLVLSQVHYTFNKVLMLQEPLLVVAAFYILFFTVIVYVRLDFSITKVPLPLFSCLC
jgi:oligosaccharyltransferase complex subunit alpha (ribophorin I)